MILRTSATKTTEEGRIPTTQLNSSQLFITVTIAVSRKFEYVFHFFIYACIHLN